MQIVNSSTYGLKRKIASIDHACSILGIRHLKRLILCAVLKQSFDSADENPFISTLWDSSLNTAVLGNFFAKELDLNISDEMYTLGMFHNAGKAVIYEEHKNYPEILEQAYLQNDLSVSLYEEKAIHTSHEIVGYQLATHWQLPSDICQVIMYHHQFDLVLMSAERPVREMCALLNTIEHISGLHKVFSPKSKDHRWEKYQKDFLEILHLDKQQVLDIYKKYCSLS